MAAKQTKLPGSAMVETVGTNLTIIRQPLPGPPPTEVLIFSAGVADHTYLVDDLGAKVKLLIQGENPRWVGFTPEQSQEFCQTPMKTADGQDTTLGAFIVALWDSLIETNLTSSN